MGLNLKDLRCYVFSGQGVPAGYEEIYEKCFQMWKSVWAATFTELKSSQTLFSDGFTRQSKIACIFVGDECATMVACREMNFALSAQREDSLLASWDGEAFDSLTVEGSRVSIASYLTVAPEFRGEIAPDLSLKTLSVMMSTHCLLDSDCDVMTGTMRCNRGTDKSAYKAGARFIKKSQMHGVEVDLVGFFKSDILKNYADSTNLWSETLWKNRVDLTSKGSLTQRDRKAA